MSPGRSHGQQNGGSRTSTPRLPVSPPCSPNESRPVSHSPDISSQTCKSSEKEQSRPTSSTARRLQTTGPGATKRPSAIGH